METTHPQPFYMRRQNERQKRHTRRSGRVIRDESHVEPVTPHCLGQGQIVHCTYKAVSRIYADMYFCVVVDEAGFNGYGTK